MLELEAVGHEALTIRMVAARAGVSPATAYTYFSSKDHLFAELFSQVLVAAPAINLTGRRPLTRLQQTTRHLATVIGERPWLSDAVNKSLLGSDPDVGRLRLRIGGIFVDRFREAVGDDADPDLLDALTLTFSGALLQVGMGLGTYDDLADRLDRVFAVVLKGTA